MYFVRFGDEIDRVITAPHFICIRVATADSIVARIPNTLWFIRVERNEILLIRRVRIFMLRAIICTDVA